MWRVWPYNVLLRQGHFWELITIPRKVSSSTAPVKIGHTVIPKMGTETVSSLLRVTLSLYEYHLPVNCVQRNLRVKIFILSITLNPYFSPQFWCHNISTGCCQLVPSSTSQPANWATYSSFSSSPSASSTNQQKSRKSHKLQGPITDLWKYHGDFSLAWKQNPNFLTMLCEAPRGLVSDYCLNMPLILKALFTPFFLKFL